MSFKGMIYDEGLWGAMRIFLNGRKKENREFFGRMSGFFNAVVGTKACAGSLRRLPTYATKGRKRDLPASSLFLPSHIAIPYRIKA